MKQKQKKKFFSKLSEVHQMSSDPRKSHSLPACPDASRNDRLHFGTVAAPEL